MERHLEELRGVRLIAYPAEQNKPRSCSFRPRIGTGYFVAQQRIARFYGRISPDSVIRQGFLTTIFAHSATLLKIGRCFMDFKERYEFCKKIESYAQMVAGCLAEQMKAERQIACERVLEHLGIVIEMMLDEIPSQDTAVILVPEPRHNHAVAASATSAA
jgi:hypothetical protein